MVNPKNWIEIPEPNKNNNEILYKPLVRMRPMPETMLGYMVPAAIFINYRIQTYLSLFIDRFDE